MRSLTAFILLMLFLGAGMAYSQRNITGIVTGADDGMPLPGVSIRVKDATGLGTITDLDGKYSLAVPNEYTTLIASFVGMTTAEVEITGNVVNISLKTEDLLVGDIVVTAVGIKRDQKALGYSVQSVDNQTLTESNNTDVINALSGRTAGVQVNSSGGTAGASSYVTIRGAASLTGNNQPLFIVDGMPVITGGGGGAVDGVATSGRSIDLNPEDIETMTILKGGAATSLYGVQAANGAIVITTKRGSEKSALDIAFSSTLAIDQISQVPGMQKKFAQGLNGNYIYGNANSWGPKISDLVYLPTAANIYNQGLALVRKADYPTQNLEPAKAFDQYDFFQTGLTFDNNVSVASGNNDIKYYFSIGNRTQEGVIPNNKFSRTTAKLNAESNLTSKLNVGANMSFINSNGNFIQQGSNVSGVMLGLLRTPPSYQNGDGSDDDTFWKMPDGGQRTYRNGGGYDNPYWTAYENYFNDDVNRFIGSSVIRYKATDWLTFTFNNGIDWYNRRYTDYLAVGSRAVPAGKLTEYSYFGRVFNSDFIANFNYKFTESFGMSAVLGHNLYSSFGKNVYGTANGLSIPEFSQLSNTADQTTGASMSNYRTQAVYGDINFDFLNMIYLGFTGRNDWSTTMPESNLSAFYPSASLGFVFSELGPLKDNNILNFGKLRASYAVTANIASAYSTANSFVQASTGDGWTDGNVFPLLGNTGYSLGDVMGNPDLRHEKQTTYEFGIDLRMFNNRVTIDASYFHNFNDDLLLSVPIARSTGFGFMYMNAAKMESYGVELSLGVTPVKTTSFTWDILANFTQFKNPVTELAEGIENVFLGGFTDPQIRAVAGEEYRSIYGYDFFRYDANGDGKTTLDEPLVINNNPNDNYPDGFPMTDRSKMVSLGTVNPEWTANVTNTFMFKGFDFSFLIDIKKGGLMYNGTRFAMNYFGTSIETENREVYYLPTGAIDFSKTPKENLVKYDGVLGYVANGKVVTDGDANNIIVVNSQAWYTKEGSNFGNGATSSAVENAGWVRLRDITLGYTYTKRLGPIEKIRVFAQGRNLWVNTPYSGVDPETSLLGADNAQGMDYFNMPGTKTVSFGVKVNF